VLIAVGVDPNAADDPIGSVLQQAIGAWASADFVTTLIRAVPE
jgi:hypothetical protein